MSLNIEKPIDEDMWITKEIDFSDSTSNTKKYFN